MKKEIIILLVLVFLTAMAIYLSQAEENRMQDSLDNSILMEGYLVMGHEVREFRPCGEGVAYWIDGKSKGYKDALSIYTETIEGTESKPYKPIYVTLKGVKTGKATDGFGLDYDAQIVIESIISSNLTKKCKEDLIKVNAPLSGGEIKSPLTIVGEARGMWFFEGSFPVVLVDENGNEIALHYATAEGEWMTEDFVRFTSELIFPEQIGGSKGTLILKKDNPSDILELDDQIEIPIVF